MVGSFGGYGQDILDIANALQPRTWAELSKGPKPGGTKGKVSLLNIDTAQFRRVYGFQLHTIEETVRDSLEDFKKRGWIQ